MMKLRIYAEVAILNVLLALLVLYGFEYYLRFNHREFGPSMLYQVDGKDYTWGHPVRTNALGYRDRELAIPKPKGTYRILALGDSFTWGVGVPEELRFSNRLEKLLREALPNRPIEVVNISAQGAPTTDEVVMLKKVVGLVEPDLILLGFCVNDPEPRKYDLGVLRLKYMQAHPLAFYPLNALKSLRMDYVSRFLKELIFNYLQRDPSRLGIKPLADMYLPESIEWQEFLRALREIKAISDSRGLPAPLFASLNQATRGDGPTPYKDPDDALKQQLKFHALARDAASALGFVSVGFEEEIANKLEGQNLAINKNDLHPSAELHRVYAEKLAAVILSKGLIVNVR